MRVVFKSGTGLSATSPKQFVHPIDWSIACPSGVLNKLLAVRAGVCAGGVMAGIQAIAVSLACAIKFRFKITIFLILVFQIIQETLFSIAKLPKRKINFYRTTKLYQIFLFRSPLVLERSDVGVVAAGFRKGTAEAIRRDELGKRIRNVTS